jgi:predicted transcriptional regulator
MVGKKEPTVMFEITKPEMINKTFRLPQALVNRLQEVAQTKNVSVNYLVAQCCEYAMQNLKNEDNKEAVSTD